MVPELEQLVAEHGSVQLLCDLSDFTSERPSAWGADLRFGREFHKKITKMAIVGDGHWEKLVADLAHPSTHKRPSTSSPRTQPGSGSGRDPHATHRRLPMAVPDAHRPIPVAARVAAREPLPAAAPHRAQVRSAQTGHWWRWSLATALVS